MSAYEYIFPHTTKLKSKPLDAVYIMKLLNDKGFTPVSVRVDNDSGQVFIYFEKALDSKSKTRLDEVVNEVFKEW